MKKSKRQPPCWANQLFNHFPPKTRPADQQFAGLVISWMLALFRISVYEKEKMQETGRENKTIQKGCAIFSDEGIAFTFGPLLS